MFNSSRLLVASKRMCAKAVAITGSPGTGKSTLAERLTDLGFQVRTVEAIALEAGALSRQNGQQEIDTSKLGSWTQSGTETCVIDGHLSHYCSIDAVIVLRCNPKKLGGCRSGVLLLHGSVCLCKLHSDTRSRKICHHDEDVSPYDQFHHKKVPWRAASCAGS